MNAQTKISAKGQVVIPKAIRDRLCWPEGAELEAIETGDGVLLKRKSIERERISMDEFRRRVPIRSSPTLTLDDMNRVIDEEAVRRFRDRSNPASQ